MNHKKIILIIIKMALCCFISVSFSMANSFVDGQSSFMQHNIDAESSYTIPIKIMPSHQLFKLDSTKLIKITKQALSNQKINIGADSKYAAIKLRLLFTKQLNPYLLVYLKSRYFTNYKLVRVNLTKGGSIIYPVQKDYKLTNEDFLAQTNLLDEAKPQCPSQYKPGQYKPGQYKPGQYKPGQYKPGQYKPGQYKQGKPLFVIGTPVYNSADYVADTSTYRSVNLVSQAVLETNKYRLVQLLDDNSTVMNYKNILACPNLKYFFHIGGEDEYGKSFLLTDGDFSADYFTNNPQLDLSNKIISFVTCRAFDKVDGGFCPSITSMPKPPSAYTAGSSELLVYGAPETYACFWKHVLKDNSIPNKETLEKCAVEYDPSVPNSHSGIYFINKLLDHNVELIIETNLRTLDVPPNDYAVLKLEPTESVKKYSIKTDSKSIECTPAPYNSIKLINNVGLKAAEFVLINREKQLSCQYEEMSRFKREGGITKDIYGFYPDDRTCFVQPAK